MRQIVFAILLLVSASTNASSEFEEKTFVEIIKACRELEIDKSTYLFSRESNAYRLGVILRNYKKSDPKKSLEVAYNVYAECKEPKIIEAYKLNIVNGFPVMDMFFDKGKRLTFEFNKENDLWVISHITSYVSLKK